MKYFENVKSMELFRCFVVPTLIVCVVVDTPFMQVLTLACTALWLGVCLVRIARQFESRVLAKMDTEEVFEDTEISEDVHKEKGKIRNLDVLRKKVSADEPDNTAKIAR